MQREEYQRYNKYKWVLWLVIISFVIWGAGTAQEKDIRLMAARVGDREISREEFIEAYRNRYELYQQFAANNPEIMKDLPRQTLDALVDRKLLLLLAEDHGFTASPEEVAGQLRDMAFLKDEAGAFVGTERYRAILRDRIKRTASEFETALAEDIVAEKFQRMVADSVLVSDPDLRAEYENSLTTRFDYVKVDVGRYTAQVTVTEEEIKERYDRDPKKYEAPEKRRAQLAYLRADQFLEQVPVSDEEARAQYEKDKESRYQQPEERRASHILFKLQGGSPADIAASESVVRAKAEAILARAKAGEDFAELARQFSEDTSAPQGGDLGFFPRGRMVGPFEESAFSLAIGQVSDLVRSEFGFHIIKLLEIKAPGHRPFEEVKASIVGQMRRPLADAMARRQAEDLQGKAATAGLEAAAKEMDVPLTDTGLFGKEDAVPGVGKSEDFAASVFAAEVGKAGPVIPIVPSFLRLSASVSIPPQGYAVYSLLEIRPPQVPPLTEARPQVERDLRAEKARDVARKEIDAMGAELASTPTPEAWKAALTARGFAVQDSGTLGPRSALPGIPDSEAVVQAAWRAQPGAAGRKDMADGGAVFYRVVERQGFDEALFASKRSELRDRLLAERRSALLGSILTAARDRFEVELNAELLLEFQPS